jgi:hypothetical protein
MPFEMDWSRLSKPLLESYAEATTIATINSGQLVLDLAQGHVFQITLTQNLDALFLLGAPPLNQTGSVMLIVAQDGSGGRTFAWPESVMWAGGVAPSVSTTPDAKDIYALVTTDGGTSWFGFVGGQTFR